MKPMPSFLPSALTIAGSDSSGGAGIQADLKTFHQFGVYGTSVLTAVTAQNTTGVSMVHAIPLDVVGGQIDAVVDDIRPEAVKTGMLATAELVTLVAERFRRHRLANLVVDPVMVATSGDRLLDTEAEHLVRETLVPLATLVTPNLHEAAILVGRAIQDEDAMRRAARVLVDELGAAAALVKGGHLEGGAVDVLWDGTEERVWRRSRIETRHTHGTGCTLSAGVAAGLAEGRALPDAVDRALTFVARAIASAPGLGRGHGPVNHLAPVE